MFFIFTVDSIDPRCHKEARTVVERSAGPAQGFRGRASMWLPWEHCLASGETRKTSALITEPHHFQILDFDNECQWMLSLFQVGWSET